MNLSVCAPMPKSGKCETLTCVRVDLVAWIVRVNMITAQTYSKSHTRTVDRIYTLLPSVSIPREASRANHDGSIHEPLQMNRQGTVRLRSADHQRTLYRTTTKRMPSKEDNPAPSTANRTCTIVGKGDGSLFPSNAFGPHSRQTSAECSVLEMTNQLYAPPKTKLVSCRNTTPSR